MPRPPAKPHIRRRSPGAGPVIVRHVLEDLTPSMRATAMRMSGGDPSKVRVISKSQFEIVDNDR